MEEGNKSFILHPVSFILWKSARKGNTFFRYEQELADFQRNLSNFPCKSQKKCVPLQAEKKYRI